MASNFTGAGPEAEIPKSVISIVVLAGALIFGLIIAKVVNVFYDRQSIRDDASDISDYTRERLKEQLALVFNKNIVKQKRRPEELTRKYYCLWRANVIRKRQRRARGEEVSPVKRTHGTIKEEGQADDSRPLHEPEPPASVSTENEVQPAGKGVTQTSTTSVTTPTPPSSPLIVTITKASKPEPKEVTSATNETATVISPPSKGAPTYTAQKGEPPFASLYAKPVTDARRKNSFVPGKNGAAEKRDSIVSRSAGSMKGKEEKRPPLRPKSGFKAAIVQPTTPKKTGTTPRPVTAKRN